MHARHAIAGRSGFVLFKKLLLCTVGIELGLILFAAAVPLMGGTLASPVPAFRAAVDNTIAAVDEAINSIIVVGHIGPVAHAYGIAAGGSLASKSQADLDAYFNDLSAAGAQWVRFDIPWSSVQPKDSSTYSWDAYDRIMQEALDRKIQVHGIIDFTPARARDSGCM